MYRNSKTLFPELNGLSSQELEVILKAELDRKAPEREKVLAILSILESREAANAQQCHESQKHAARREQPAVRWLRNAAVAAAILLLFVFITPPVFGAENIVELVGRWTQDLFALFRSDSPEELQTGYAFHTDHPGLQQIYDAVTEQGITQRVVPTWIPEECELVDWKIGTASEGMIAYAYLAGDDHHVIITMASYIEEPDKRYFKENEDACLYEMSGIKHYIVPNDTTWSAAWASDGVECSIVTTYDENILKQILDSIYVKGE